MRRKRQVNKNHYPFLKVPEDLKGQPLSCSHEPTSCDICRQTIIGVLYEVTTKFDVQVCGRCLYKNMDEYKDEGFSVCFRPGIVAKTIHSKDEIREKQLTKATRKFLDLSQRMEDMNSERQLMVLMEIYKLVKNHENVGVYSLGQLYEYLGTVYLDLSEYEKSKLFFEMALQKFIEFDPKDEDTIVDFLHKIAETSYSSKSYDKALDYYLQIFDQHKLKVGQKLLLRIGMCYLHLEDYAEAKEYFKRVTKKKLNRKQWAKVLNLFGQLYCHQFKFSKGLRAFDRALSFFEKDDQKYGTFMWKAKTLIYMNKPRLAIQTLEKVTSRGHQEARGCLLLLARAYHMLGNIEYAVKCFEEYFKLPSGHSPKHIQREIHAYQESARILILQAKEPKVMADKARLKFLDRMSKNYVNHAIKMTTEYISNQSLKITETVENFHAALLYLFAFEKTNMVLFIMKGSYEIGQLLRNHFDVLVTRSFSVFNFRFILKKTNWKEVMKSLKKTCVECFVAIPRLQTKVTRDCVLLWKLLIFLFDLFTGCPGIRKQVDFVFVEKLLMEFEKNIEESEEEKIMEKQISETRKKSRKDGEDEEDEEEDEEDEKKDDLKSDFLMRAKCSVFFFQARINIHKKRYLKAKRFLNKQIKMEKQEWKKARPKLFLGQICTKLMVRTTDPVHFNMGIAYLRECESLAKRFVLKRLEVDVIEAISRLYLKKMICFENEQTVDNFSKAFSRIGMARRLSEDNKYHGLELKVLKSLSFVFFLKNEMNKGIEWGLYQLAKTFQMCRKYLSRKLENSRVGYMYFYYFEKAKRVLDHLINLNLDVLEEGAPIGDKKKEYTKYTSDMDVQQRLLLLVEIRKAMDSVNQSYIFQMMLIFEEISKDEKEPVSFQSFFRKCNFYSLLNGLKIIKHQKIVGITEPKERSVHYENNIKRNTDFKFEDMYFLHFYCFRSRQCFIRVLTTKNGNIVSFYKINIIFKQKKKKKKKSTDQPRSTRTFLSSFRPSPVSSPTTSFLSQFGVAPTIKKEDDSSSSTSLKIPYGGMNASNILEKFMKQAMEKTKESNIMTCQKIETMLKRVHENRRKLRYMNSEIIEALKNPPKERTMDLGNSVTSMTNILEFAKRKEEEELNQNKKKKKKKRKKKKKKKKKKMKVTKVSGKKPTSIEVKKGIQKKKNGKKNSPSTGRRRNSGKKIASSSKKNGPKKKKKIAKDPSKKELQSSPRRPRSPSFGRGKPRLKGLILPENDDKADGGVLRPHSPRTSPGFQGFGQVSQSGRVPGSPRPSQEEREKMRIEREKTIQYQKQLSKLITEENKYHSEFFTIVFGGLEEYILTSQVPESELENDESVGLGDGKGGRIGQLQKILMSRQRNREARIKIKHIVVLPHDIIEKIPIQCCRVPGTDEYLIDHVTLSLGASMVHVSSSLSRYELNLMGNPQFLNESKIAIFAAAKAAPKPSKSSSQSSSQQQKEQRDNASSPSFSPVETNESDLMSSPNLTSPSQSSDHLERGMTRTGSASSIASTASSASTGDRERPPTSGGRKSRRGSMKGKGHFSRNSESSRKKLSSQELELLGLSFCDSEFFFREKMNLESFQDLVELRPSCPNVIHISAESLESDESKTPKFGLRLSNGEILKEQDLDGTNFIGCDIVFVTTNGLFNSSTGQELKRVLVKINASSVILSAWDAPEFVSYLLSQSFYRNLNEKKEPKALALRNAMRKLMRYGSSAFSLEHIPAIWGFPVLWGGIV